MDEQKQSNKINLLNQEDIKEDIQKDFLETPKKPGLPKWVIILIGIIAIGVISYFTYQYYFIPEKIFHCEQDTKVCPDGSHVDRIAPDCEFAECSEVVAPVDGWQSYINTMFGISFKYPVEYDIPEEVSEYYIWLMSPLTTNKNKAPESQGGDLYIKDEELLIEVYRDYSIDDDYCEKHIREYFSEKEVFKQADIIIDNIEAVHYQWLGERTGEIICLIHNGYHYSIYKYPFKTSRQNEFDQILSTFKFIE